MAAGRKLGWVGSPERARGSINVVTEPTVSQPFAAVAPSANEPTCFDPLTDLA